MKTPKKVSPPWNKCDVCGRYISYWDFSHGKATRRLIQEDAEGFIETYETLCKKHK